MGIPVVKNALEKDSAVLMDALPRKKFLKETIPGSSTKFCRDIVKFR